jgi:hypothetical protein
MGLGRRCLAAIDGNHTPLGSAYQNKAPATNPGIVAIHHSQGQRGCHCRIDGVSAVSKHAHGYIGCQWVHRRSHVFGRMGDVRLSRQRSRKANGDQQGREQRLQASTSDHPINPMHSA